METEKLLTIKQFADAVGVSQQAVYQSIQGKLKPYMILEQGKKYISSQAIIDLYGNAENAETISELKGLVQEKQAEIESLNKEVEKLENNFNKEIENLNKNLEKLELNLNKELEKNDSLKEIISDKDKEIARLERIQEELKENSTNLNNSLIEVKTRAEEREKLIEILQDDKEKLNNQIKDLKDIISKMQEDNADIVTSLKQLTADNTKLQYQIQEYQERPQKRPGFFKRLLKK